MGDSWGAAAGLWVAGVKWACCLLLLEALLPKSRPANMPPEELAGAGSATVSSPRRSPAQQKSNEMITGRAACCSQQCHLHEVADPALLLAPV